MSADNCVATDFRKFVETYSLDKTELNFKILLGSDEMSARG